MLFHPPPLGAPMARKAETPARPPLGERLKEHWVVVLIGVLATLAAAVGGWLVVGEKVMTFLDRDRIAAERDLDRLADAIDRAEADVAASEAQGRNVEFERTQVQRAKQHQQRATTAHAAGDYEEAQRLIGLAHEELDRIDRTKVPGPDALLLALALAGAAALGRRRVTG